MTKPQSTSRAILGVTPSRQQYPVNFKITKGFKRMLNPPVFNYKP